MAAEITPAQPDAAFQAEIAHDQAAGRAERTLALGLILSGIRCTLQYAILPFVLPLLGLSEAVAVEITLVINVIAVVSIVLSIRKFWRIRYKHRVAYTVVGVTALVILAAFTAQDLGILKL
jgi:NADH:ubiquinone oxidoreductase subunit 4 (subunit M)